MKVEFPVSILIKLFGPMAAGCLLVACQSGAPSKDLSLNTKRTPVDAVATIAKVAQKCWFKSGDAAFRDFRLSSEVNSYAGRPRILLVKRSDPNGLPQLVVQAEQRGDQTSGKFTRVQTFGPLLQTRHGSRINADVTRWSNGNSNCKAS